MSRLVTTGLSNDVVNLLNLSLSSLESTKSLLSDLSSSLLTSVSDQLHKSSLVWGKTSNLSDDGTNKSGSLGSSTLSVRDLWDLLEGLDLSTLVETNSNTCGKLVSTPDSYKIFLFDLCCVMREYMSCSGR